MASRLERSAKASVDFVRTAPLGESIILFGLWVASIGLVNFRSELGPLVVISAPATGIGVVMAVPQFHLRRKLEKYVRNHGYNDRYFKKTVGQWCDEQTATVVARNAGHLDDYLNLLEPYSSGRRSIKRLTHF